MKNILVKQESLLTKPDDIGISIVSEYAVLAESVNFKKLHTSKGFHRKKTDAILESQAVFWLLSTTIGLSSSD
jgi:hypothetical protein